MRAFVALRKSLINYQQLRDKLEQMESKYDYQFKVIFEAIERMLYFEEEGSKRKIGFDVETANTSSTPKRESELSPIFRKQAYPDISKQTPVQ